VTAQIEINCFISYPLNTGLITIFLKEQNWNCYRLLMLNAVAISIITTLSICSPKHCSSACYISKSFFVLHGYNHTVECALWLLALTYKLLFAQTNIRIPGFWMLQNCQNFSKNISKKSFRSFRILCLSFFFENCPFKSLRWQSDLKSYCVQGLPRPRSRACLWLVQVSGWCRRSMN